MGYRLTFWNIDSVSDTSTAQQQNVRMKQRIVKISVLTICVSMSTIINWVLYFAHFGHYFLYLDLWLNVLFVDMMHKHNDFWYYKVLCFPCKSCLKWDKTQRELIKMNMSGIKTRTRSTSGTSANKPQFSNSEPL